VFPDESQKWKRKEIEEAAEELWGEYSERAVKRQFKVILAAITGDLRVLFNDHEAYWEGSLQADVDGAREYLRSTNEFGHGPPAGAGGPCRSTAVVIGWSP
jgi:hypothetical protein